MKRKNTAKEIVDSVIANVDAQIKEPTITIDKPKVDEVLHYYRCNVTIDNGKPCNCTAFI